ncbi:MAG: glycosyltransferase family 2 protein [Micrococcales bacterium]|nr:glycosyltransferase family 2 protein [Micrococcales bacterium]
MRISVVIPVKDDELYLERCLEALHRQSRLAEEIVVVDNGGSAMTAQIAAWWNVRCVAEARPGITAAAAAGYDAATGDVIARLDADSVPAADWVERVALAFADQPGLDAVTGPGDFVSLPAPLRRIADLAYMDAYFAVFGRLAGHAPVFGSNFAMQRRLWREVRRRTHRWDTGVHDDLDLSLCVAPETRVRLDRTLRVAVSSRPFVDPRGFARRIHRAVHTVAVNRRTLTGRLREHAAA